MKMIKLFLTAFMQVAFVSANTYFLSKVNYIGALICGFSISWLWSSNVRKISLGTTKERLIYCSGASLGGLVGLFLSQFVYGL